MRWNQLLEEAASLVKQGRAILEEYEGKELPADKAAEVDRLFDEAERKKAEADRLKRAAELDKFYNQPDRIEAAKHDTKSLTTEDKTQREAQLKAFKNYLHYGTAGLSAEDVKQLSSLRDPEGGYILSLIHI